MEDYDWIEIAYLFDDEPSVTTYESLLETLPRYPDDTLGADEFYLDYSDGDDVDKLRIPGSTEEAADVLATYPNCRISVPMGLKLYDISIGFSKTGVGLLSSTSRPYLRFATTVYPFEDANGDENVRADLADRRREFLEILTRAADILEPKWGFGRRGGIAVGADETVNDLTSRTTPPLYEYNVFRPETVEALGRERVRSAPAWYVEELDNGGAFLAVREPPRQCSPAVEPCLEVAEHLGVPLGKTDRYH